MIETYKFDSENLEKIIEKDRKFELVLPHFQRRFVWNVKDQKSLLQSMLSGIPVGSILLLEDRKDSYVSRPLCFNELDPKISDDKCIFLLDGQQRVSTMKSMFCDLFSPKEIERFDEVDDWKGLLSRAPSKLHNRWFINVDNENDIFGLKTLDFDGNKPLDPSDFDDCVYSYKIFKGKNNDYNPDETNEKLVNWSVSKKSMPLCLLLEDKFSFREILQRIASNKFGESKGSRKIEEWADSVIGFLIERTLKTDIHEIILDNEKGMQIGISIFEQVNRGGVKLDVYDLIVARMAFHKKNLTDEIKRVFNNEQRIIAVIDNDTRDGFEVENLGVWDDKENIPSKEFKKSFKNCLNICVLKNKNDLTNLSDKYIKEKELLNLSKDEIFDNWQETVQILFSVLQFLHFRCGVAKLKDIPYELLIVPLFVFFAKHNNDPSKKDVDKIEFWYWSSILSGYYREKQSTRVIKDSKIIINGGDFKDRFDKIFDDTGYSDKKSLTRERDNGRQPQLDRMLIQYVISKEPYDLQGTKKKERTKITSYKQAKSVSDEGINTQEHHIIPINEIADNEQTNGEELRKNKLHSVNSMLNKVVISDEANWKILRISDYSDNSNHLNCRTNFIPLPNDKQYTKKDKYDLKTFLSDRFDLLKKNIEEHLERLITD
ncbi:M. jannaschii predicted coding region MJ0686 [uncultured Candidatus Thioglobus sp.]|nr:M. jannaschii predicted coding region MJ0686 [uncultured Candidatus Thioglobus sp.]